VPYLEPANSQEALLFARLAFTISEEFDTPVLIRSTTRVSHSRSVVEIGERETVPVRPYQKCAPKFVMIPAFARERRKVLEERLQKLQQWVEETPLNQVELRDPSLGIITGGVLYDYLREIAPSVSILKLGVGYPLPVQKIREFAQQVKRLVILEELDPIWERELKALGIPVEGRNLFPGIGEITPDTIIECLFPEKKREYVEVNEYLPRPPVLCAGCPHRGVFKVLKDLSATVCGDIGCYTLGTLPPLSSMDTCICMGASISMAEGIKLAHPERPVVAVLGDSTFIHAGIPPLIDVVYNKTPIVVLILDNGTTAMTGGQEHPATGKTLSGEDTVRLDFPALGQAIGIPRVERVNAYHIEKLRTLLQEAFLAQHPTLLIIEGLCQLKKRERHTPFAVQDTFCLHCGLCVSTGCPAIENGDVIRIIFERCAGCSICAQLCPFEAIKEVQTP
ncbi:MAG: thiamine pyrophosphate-dependent enzyme, partial [Atribacterota bacterium]